MQDFTKCEIIQDKKTGMKLLVNIQSSANILAQAKARVKALDGKIVSADSQKANAIKQYNKLIKERDVLQIKINELEA